jgi:hypothetical protein
VRHVKARHDKVDELAETVLKLHKDLLKATTPLTGVLEAHHRRARIVSC